MQPKPFLMKANLDLTYNKEWHVIIWTTTEELAKSYTKTVVDEFFQEDVVRDVECLGLPDCDASHLLSHFTYYGTVRAGGYHVHS